MAQHRCVSGSRATSGAYETFQAFGVICSPTANSYFDGRLAYVPGWEDVLVWDVKRGEMVTSSTVERAHFR